MAFPTSSILCSKCGTPAPVGASFCPQCGNRLLEGVAPSPQQDTAISSIPAGEQSSATLSQPQPATKADPLPQLATPSPTLPFGWWPRSRAGATFTAVVLVYIFLTSIPGFFGALFNVSLTFLVITGIRYGWYRFRPTTAKPTFDSTPAPKTPLWRHPVIIGVSVCCILFLFLAIQSSSNSSMAKQQYAASLQQNQAAYDRYNSTGKIIGRTVEGVARGYVGDNEGVSRRMNEVEAQNRAYAERNGQFRAGYAAAASSENEAGMLIGAVLFILFGIGAFFLFRRFKKRLLKLAPVAFLMRRFGYNKLQP